MPQHDRIEVNPKVMFGKPVIRGTRIPVDMLLRKLGDGLGFDEILAEHPRLRREDLLAVLAYAADVIANEEIHTATPAPSA